MLLGSVGILASGFKSAAYAGGLLRQRLKKFKDQAYNVVLSASDYQATA